MSLCYKLKFFNRCGKAGHNPYRCWTYWSIDAWLARARELDRCRNCLSPWKFNTLVLESTIFCKHCGEGYKDMDTKETKECQTELQETKTIIEELNSKISALEIKLNSSKATNNELNWQWQSAVKEKEQELHKVNELNSLCNQKEIELRELQKQIGQRDIELEQHRGTSAQPYKTVPVVAQRPSQTSNHLDHINETIGIKSTLADLQDQQQKISVVVNHLYNTIKTQDMHWLNYPSFKPYLGPYDTGQFFQ